MTYDVETLFICLFAMVSFLFKILVNWVFVFLMLSFKNSLYILELSVGIFSSWVILSLPMPNLLISPLKAFFISVTVSFIYHISFWYFLGISISPSPCLQFPSVLACCLLYPLEPLAYYILNSCLDNFNIPLCLVLMVALLLCLFVWESLFFMEKQNFLFHLSNDSPFTNQFWAPNTSFQVT